MEEKINFDEEGEVINGPATYKEIASILKDNRSCIIGWTDGEATHFDILFNTYPTKYGAIQGGIYVYYLFVSVMRIGAFAFNTNRDTELYGNYVDEKIGMGNSLGSTADKLAELINGIIKEL